MNKGTAGTSQHVTINTDVLLQLKANAEKNDYNRQLRDEVKDDIDPDGQHVLRYHFMHNHRAGSPCESHVRTVWMAKMKGQFLPAPLMIDIDMDTWLNLFGAWKDMVEKDAIST